MRVRCGPIHFATNDAAPAESFGPISRHFVSPVKLIGDALSSSEIASVPIGCKVSRDGEERAAQRRYVESPRYSIPVARTNTTGESGNAVRLASSGRTTRLTSAGILL